MDEMIPFRDKGDIKLTVPLAPPFQQILQDFVRITVIKSGFSREESGRIAQRISSRIFQKLPLAVGQANHQPVEISMTHCPGQITIRTVIPGLGFKDQEIFKSR
jgi:hypothetical protein